MNELSPEVAKLRVICDSNTTLRDCLRAIEINERGFVILTDIHHVVLGVLSDGDIRRHLLAGVSIEAQVDPVINKNYKFVKANEKREAVLRLLDQKIKFLPVQDQQNRLTGVITPDGGLVPGYSATMEAKAIAPARVSFSGGGTDLTTFFIEHGGAVLNATIDVYARCHLKRNPYSTNVVIMSNDLNLTITADKADDLRYDGKLDLIKAAIKILKPDFGFEAVITSDFPPSSGLGGSSVILAAVIGAFNEFRADPLSDFEIAEMAFQAERIELGLEGGWQDQYAAVFGGVNFMEFTRNRNEINGLKINREILDELEDRLLICYTGKAHSTNVIHKQQKHDMVNNPEITQIAIRTRDIALEMKHQLQKGALDHFGELLHEAWTIKQRFSSLISDSELSELYNFAILNGAVGGKILGAGGGGFFLFQASRDSRFGLKNALEARGLNCRSVRFDDRGLRSWRVRAG